MQRKVSESERIANVENDWRKALAAAPEPPRTMDWLGMEATIRAYIKATNNQDLDEIVGRFTGRGYELPCPKCGQMLHVDSTCDYKWQP